MFYEIEYFLKIWKIKHRFCIKIKWKNYDIDESEYEMLDEDYIDKYLELFCWFYIEKDHW